MSVAGLERMATGSVAQRLTLSRHIEMVFKKNIMDENDPLSERIPLGHNRIDGAVYCKINQY